MPAPAKKPTKPAAPPKPPVTRLAYVYCENASCTYHATFLASKAGAPQAGDPCPASPKEHKLQRIELTTRAPVAEPTGAALTVVPGLTYGGFALALGDSDDEKRWGGQVVSDPRHEGARYVAELQRDLFVLGFYSHGRAQNQDSIGVFSVNLMAAVLDFKRHLGAAFGLPYVAEPPQGNVPLSDDTPIVYARLTNPFYVFQPIYDLDKFVRGYKTKKVNQPPIATRFASWGAEWTKLKGKPGGKGETFAKLGQAFDAFTRACSEEVGHLKDVATPTSLPSWMRAFELPDPPLPKRVHEKAKTLAEVKSHAIGLVDEAIGKASTGGAFGEIVAKHRSLTEEWSAAKMREPAGWADLPSKVAAARVALDALRDAIQAMDMDQAVAHYRQLQRNYGAVDRGTAHAARQMAFGGVFRNRGVFRVPTKAEMELVEGSIDDALIKRLLEGVPQGERLDRAPDELPRELMLGFVRIESGKAQTFDFGSRSVVVYGIDYRNSFGVSNSDFHELATRPDVWSSSRGWGLSQMTMFTAPTVESWNKDAADEKLAFRYVSGIPVVAEGELRRPLPKLIQSPVFNLQRGLIHYIDAFKRDSNKRDCTYKTRFDCVSCLAHFERRSSAAGGDFVPVPEGDTASYTQKDSKKVMSLLKPAGATPAPFSLAELPTADLNEPLSDAQKNALALAMAEFPCSWLTALIRYNGRGEHAWSYLMTVISTKVF